MSTVLITGANRGIGLELARRYRARDWTVIGTCRHPADAMELAELGADVRALDVTDTDQVLSLARDLDATPIDVLVNNAGVFFRDREDEHPIDVDLWAETFRVNTMAPFTVSQAFVDHVAVGGEQKIITISSILGCITETSGGMPMYRSSKAAVNMVMASLAADLKDRGVIVAVLHPGWVRTRMGGAEAAIDVETSGAGLIKVIDSLRLADSGGFFDYTGKRLAW